MRKLPFLILIFALTTTGLAAGPILTTDIDTIDLGVVPQNTEFSRDIVLRSTGDKPVTISEVNTFCPCIEFPLDNMVIPPGDSTIVHLRFKASSYVGHKEWRLHIYSNAESKVVRIRLLAFIVADIRMHKPIYVFPYFVNASQYGGVTLREFPFYVINRSDEYVPLKLIYADEKYYTLDFPAFISPNDSAFGKVTIKENNIDREFDTYITFEFIDNKSEKHLYSIPIKRKIFTPKK